MEIPLTEPGKAKGTAGWEEGQKFSFKLVRFEMLMRYPNRDIKWVIQGIGEEIQAEEIHVGVVSTQMVPKAVKVDAVARGR